MSTSRRFVPYFLVTASLSLGYGSVLTLLAEFRQQFGFSESQLGVIAGAGFFSGFAAQLFLARFADRGYAPLLIRGGVVCAVAAMVWMALADQLWQFVVARLLLGLGSGAVGPAMRRLVISRDPDNVGANLGMMTAYDVSGFVLGPVVAAVFAEIAGLRAPFVVLGLLYLALLPLAFRLDLRSEVADDVARRVRDLVRLPGVQAGMAAMIAFQITIGVFEATWAVLLADLGASTLLIGGSLSLLTVPMIVMAPIGGRTAQRVGPMRTAGYGIGVAALCALSYGFFGLWPILLVSLVHAVADSYTMPSVQVAVAVSSPPSQLAAAQGLLSATGLFVASVWATGGGAIYDHAGREVLYTLVAVAMGAALAVALWRGRDLVRPPEPQAGSAPAPA